ncbi:MAG: four helix bundle protein [Phycisphaerae bacterium]|nr:four helix bundle protein [Phycisphaerae bacterium]
MTATSITERGHAIYRERDIQRRTFLFAARILQMVRLLSQDVASQVVARQVAKSGTSIGANVEEAQGSHSRAEFSRRMGIARSEARETLYWLRLLGEAGMVPAERLADITREAEELVKILTTIVKKSRQTK